MQQIRAGECACALRVSQVGAQSGEIVAEYITGRASCDVRSAARAVIQDSRAAARLVPNHERCLTLRNAIAEFHSDNVAGAAVGD